MFLNLCCIFGKKIWWNGLYVNYIKFSNNDFYIRIILSSNLIRFTKYFDIFLVTLMQDISIQNLCMETTTTYLWFMAYHRFWTKSNTAGAKCGAGNFLRVGVFAETSIHQIVSGGKYEIMYSWHISSRYVFSYVMSFRIIHFILISTAHALFLTCPPVSIYGT